MASENLILILPDYYQITSDINANLLSEVKYMFVVWIMSHGLQSIQILLKMSRN